MPFEIKQGFEHHVMARSNLWTDCRLVCGNCGSVKRMWQGSGSQITDPKHLRRLPSSNWRGNPHGASFHGNVTVTYMCSWFAAEGGWMTFLIRSAAKQQFLSYGTCNWW